MWSAVTHINTYIYQKRWLSCTVAVHVQAVEQNLDHSNQPEMTVYANQLYNNSLWLHLDQLSSSSLVGTVSVPLIQWWIRAIVYFMVAEMGTVVGEEHREEQTAHKQAFSDRSANSWKCRNAITSTCKTTSDL